ncbi:hypothetical protein C7974DRAFT_43479 [Boeremia exigua]|uniref:uncharacterized protein n=1 Tax=Boeremia exigua TaxID=749465 RepID=UPI001E8E5C06|nr:uncharacterized protein C7974DRAFT_43479 [Boeremia exigua]KAH6616353.1 hypothetical protein C7974DRAFT_43479 [Boeremia exigua]
MTSRPQHMDLVTSSPATSSVRTASTASTASTSRASLRATTTTIPSSAAAVDARPARPGLVSRASEISPTKASRPRRHLSTKSSSAVPTLSALNASNNEKSAPTTTATKPAARPPPKFGKMTASNTGAPSAAADLLRQAMGNQSGDPVAQLLKAHDRVTQPLVSFFAAARFLLSSFIISRDLAPVAARPQ